MNGKSDDPRPAWFVGAAFSGYQDQTERFIREGVWEGGPAETYGELIDSVRPGDRIAIKACYTRKYGLRFDNRGEFVAVMSIKATGTVVENLGDRRSLRVDWTPIEPPREWYFHVFRSTIAPILPETWWKQALIRFAFDGVDQDFKRTLQDPFWGEKYGYPDDREDQESCGTPPDYDLGSIISDGCFLDGSTLESMLQCLQSRRNLILQGPPGTGKTWLAKRLAYALIGQKDDERIRQIQFHPNLSYEDLVRGWRPRGDGALGLEDGPFLQLSEVARRDPGGTYVMVIEEINRGNPASIFGELLTLLEADKRTADHALTLAHQREPGERFFVPSNLHVIGTMNLADRSLALVDLALRRRFAFFDLEPAINDTWRNWVHGQCGIPKDFLDDVSRRIRLLNDRIADDADLGPQFRIGHSFLVPAPGEPVAVPGEWFAQVVETEIAPLLREYWFDDRDRADEAKEQLLGGP